MVLAAECLVKMSMSSPRKPDPHITHPYFFCIKLFHVPQRSKKVTIFKVTSLEVWDTSTLPLKPLCSIPDVTQALTRPGDHG